MNIKINVGSNIKEVIKNYLNLQNKSVSAAITRALNTTGKQANKKASIEIRNVYNLKASDLKKATKVTHAQLKSHAFIIDISNKPVELHRFSAREKNAGKYKGVSVLVKKYKGRKLVDGGFMTKKLTGVFKRVGKTRLPIRRLYGPSPGIMSLAPSVREMVSDTVAVRFPINLRRELEREIYRLNNM